MGCDISGEQLWSWIDRDAAELEAHLAVCPECRERASHIREEIGWLSPEKMADVPLPEKIGPYAIKRLLGEGGQALVYEAEQPSPRRRVALKVLKGGYRFDKNRIKQFVRETQSLARLNHPSIATIYESKRTEEGLHYFAMEMVDGLPLHTFVSRNKPGQNELLKLFLKLLEAVQYAHAEGVIHRDLKPSNIMINPAGEPKILDFGLARLTRADEYYSVSMTSEHKVEGTPRYMSPEQARGLVNKIDARSDIYTLGVILYEMLTGEPPNDVSVFNSEAVKTICEVDPRKPSSRNKSLHADLDAILLKALNKEPDRRYAKVAELAADLRRYLDGEPVLARTPSWFYPVRKKLRKHRMPVAMVAIVVTIISVLAYLALPPGDDVADIRGDLLEARYLIFRDGATDALYSRAMRAPTQYADIPEAYLLRAQAYCSNREQVIAIRYLEDAVERDTTLWPCRIMLEELGSRTMAAKSGSPLQNPWNSARATSANAWYLRSFATLDLRHAVEWAGEALELDNNHELAKSFLVRMTGLSSEPEIAVDASRELIEAGLADNGVYQLRIKVLTRIGRFQEALKYCDVLVARTNGSISSLALRARLLRQMGDYGRADEEITKAIEAAQAAGPLGANTYAWLYFHRGTIRWLLGRKDEAIADYQTAHNGMPYATYADARLFVLLCETGQPERAKQVLASARLKGNAAPWLLEIFSCLEGQLAPDLLVASGEIGDDKMRRCEAYYYAGETYLRMGSVDQARLMFEKCIGTGVKSDPNTAMDSMSEYELAGLRLERLKD